jgi:hypothetical protein
MDPLGYYDLPEGHGFELNPDLEKELPFDAVFHLIKEPPGAVSYFHFDETGAYSTASGAGGATLRLAGVCFGIIRTPTRKPFTSAIKLAVTSPAEWAGCLAICWFDSRSEASVPGVVEIRPVEEDPTP